MKKVVVIGSGLAAVGAVKGLLQQGIRPLVLDIGYLPPTAVTLGIKRLSAREPRLWTSAERGEVSANAGVPGRVVPRKLVFGSDYFYSQDEADLEGFANFASGSPPWSPALGGFSVGWGAAVLPPAPSDLMGWPYSHGELLDSVHAVVRGLPCSEPVDDLTRVFGKISERERQVISLTPGQERLLDRLRSAAVRQPPLVRAVAGQSRLLTEASQQEVTACRKCGFCSSGCVYGSIYTARHDFERWIAADVVDYRRVEEVFRVVETREEAFVAYKATDGSLKKEPCEQILLAAGAVNSTRILMNSAPVELGEVCIQRTGGVLQIYGSLQGEEMAWPTINTQTSHFVDLLDESASSFWSHAQVGLPNELILRRLGVDPVFPNSLRSRLVRRAAGHFISVALNAHSSHGPQYVIRIDRSDHGLAPIWTRQMWSESARSTVMRLEKRMQKLMRTAGYVAIPFLRQDSAAAQGYHFGASFPMSSEPHAPTDTDDVGRPFGWKRVHLVDTASLPAIPATTVGLLTMAHAHRISSCPPTR